MNDPTTHIVVKAEGVVQIQPEHVVITHRQQAIITQNGLPDVGPVGQNTGVGSRTEVARGIIAVKRKDKIPHQVSGVKKLI